MKTHAHVAVCDAPAAPSSTQGNDLATLQGYDIYFTRYVNYEKSVKDGDDASLLTESNSRCFRPLSMRKSRKRSLECLALIHTHWREFVTHCKCCERLVVFSSIVAFWCSSLSKTSNRLKHLRRVKLPWNNRSISSMHFCWWILQILTSGWIHCRVIASTWKWFWFSIWVALLSWNKDFLLCICLCTINILIKHSAKFFRYQTIWCYSPNRLSFQVWIWTSYATTNNEWHYQGVVFAKSLHIVFHHILMHCCVTTS